MLFKTKPIAYSMALAFGGLSALGAAQAQQAEQAGTQQRLERVEVTGSSIRRADVETVVPISVFTREDIQRSGATTAAEILERLPMNSGQGVQAATGLGDAARPGQNSPSLRGLGSNRTLVLLDGQRLTPYAFGGDGTDINQIPAAVIERIEILRDGASAIYGTDAIGGVINFITRSDYQGINVGANYEMPQQNGGERWLADLTLGYGDLASQRFNVWVTASFQEQKEIAAKDRWFAKTAYIPNPPGGASADNPPINRLSSNATPANILTPAGAFRNPYAPAFSTGPGASVSDPRAGLYTRGCEVPISYDLTSTGTRCRYDYAATIDIVQPFEQKGVNGKFTFQVNPDNQIFVSAFNTIFNITNRISATPASEATTFNGDPILYPAGGKYYPGAGIVPAIPGTTLSGDLNLYWRSLAAGPRETEVESNQGRWLVGAQGLLAGWDYTIVGGQAWSKVTENYTDGYLSEARLTNAIWDPVAGNTSAGCIAYVPGTPIGPKSCGYLARTIDPNINPFSTTQDAAGAAALSKAKINQQTRDSKVTGDTINGKVSRDIYNMPAGALGLAVGFDYAKQTYEDNLAAVVSSGDIVGGAGDQQSVYGDRTVYALYGEMLVPILKNLTGQVALRWDDYSDFGNTLNPKIGLRYQPVQNLLIRGSWMTGFRAPTLDNLYSPVSQTNTGGVYDDPNYEFLNGGAGVGCTVRFNPVYCGAQFDVKQGGNQNLEPETSDQWSVGFVWDATPNVSIGMDYYNISLKQTIGIINGDTKFQDYIDNFNFATGTSTSRYAKSIVKNSLGYTEFIDSRFENIAREKTSGIDIDIKARLARTSAGNFSVGFLGSYILTAETKLDGDAEYESYLGVYSRSGPVQRFRATTQANWDRGPWNATLTNRYLGGYDDQQGSRSVEAYSLWDIQGQWTGIKGVALVAGVLNVLNTAPPYSNQNSYFQVGYDPTYADPRGRTYYVRARYSY